MEGYLVVRTWWDYSDKQSNSQELKETFDLAKKRMYTILGGDIGKDTVAFEIVTILNAQSGEQVRVEVIDNRPEPEPEPNPGEEVV